MEEKVVQIGRAIIPVKTQEIADHNILGVIAGTTGWQKDKWDCHTYFAISDNASTNMNAVILKDDNDDEDKMVALYLNGESELVTFMCALKFALDTLTAKAKETIPGFNLERAYEERTKDYSNEEPIELITDDNI